MDHSIDLEEIRDCLALGCTSVMVDGSQLPFAENVALTRAVVAHAHDVGVWVEAGLGALAGDEDASTSVASGELTDPAQAVEFVDRTGVDVLAAAVGTVHGFTTSPVHVDLERLEMIARLTGVSQALHGASGLSNADLTAAVKAGIGKSQHQCGAAPCVSVHARRRVAECRRRRTCAAAESDHRDA